MEQIHAVILAAGRSERLGTVDKLWVNLCGKPLFQWSIEAFNDASEISGITVVTRPESFEKTTHLIQTLHLRKSVDVILGGQTRMESVSKACCNVDATYVAVHDGARPLITSQLIDSVCSAVRGNACACLSLPVVETVVRIQENKESERVSRTNLYSLQTPQVIRRDIWLQGQTVAETEKIDATDDTQMATLMGHTVVQVPGHRSNIKVTYAEDIDYAEQMLMQRRNREYRTGFGYDIHRTSSDRPCFLGGILFESSPVGLVGHSDADVLLHAICDALLGASSLGDIGVHFPPSDSKNKDRPSSEFLIEVHNMLSRDGWTIGNIDATVIAECPKVMSKALEIRKHIGGLLNMSIDSISVKATTNENLGAIGNGDGIAAHAVASVYR